MDWSTFLTYLLQGSIVLFVLLMFYAFLLLLREGMKD